MDTSELKGALYDPREGHLDPYGVTNALAAASRAGGATVKQNCLVTGLEQRTDGSWTVRTDDGDWHAEHVINAAGLWAREVGAMAGLDLPLVPFEHHYLISGDIPELDEIENEIPVTADLDGEIYLRQEGKGVLFGVYEKNPTAWALDGTPWEYGETDLLPERLENIEDSLLSGFERFAPVAEAGIRRIVNGPFTFTPDGNPLVGPVRGLRNYWTACGCMAGFSQAGGLALALSQWMIDGEPHMDVQGMDVARFGEFATQQYVVARAGEFYAKRMALVAPNEPWESARPNKVTPVYPIHRDNNAVFGELFAQENPMWFAPEGDEPYETPTFRRSNAFPHVAEECRAVREAAGVFDITAYGTYIVEGDGAAAWLDWLLACRLPQKGRMRIAPMLDRNGRLRGDLTVARLGEHRFIVTGSGTLQEIHMRWFEQHLPESGVHIQNVTDHFGGVSVSGPKSQEILQKLTRTDISAIPFMGICHADVADTRATVARISLTGEKGYEVTVPAQQLYRLYSALLQAGEPLGLKPFGVWALMSLRLEKAYGIWSREFTSDDTPEMSDLIRFVDMKKPDFVGKSAMLARANETPARRLVQLAIDTHDCDALGYEPIFLNDQYVGYTTSGGYGHYIKQSLALGYVNSDVSAGSGIEVEVLGDRYSGVIHDEPLYDPESQRLRG